MSEQDQLTTLVTALVTLASMQDRLASHEVTVHKLRKLLDITKSSEKLGAILKKAKTSSVKKKKRNFDDKEGFTPVKPSLSFMR